ncbi:hypothetical protein E0H73_09510 [Kribbella pittospori]|uniref:Copper chaperone PCu(A)C n=1 Tax=Kribbella pittospori TaxID=722689 RepID=A0A4R0L744_9ACTN|nr:hypothetical protein [Kribbella pittospori]TCC64605.1 hypothetical protein E0H73_09510 [Kribbella pittospori]
MPITLSSRFVRRTALAGAAATLSIALAACGANFNAQTAKPYQAAEGTNADSGSIKVRNMLVLATADGKGELHSAIINDGSTDDTLVKIEQAPPGTQDGQAGGDQPGQVTFSEFAPIVLKAGTSTMLPAAGSETASATPTETPSADPTATPTETPSGDASRRITVTGGKPGQMINVVITFGQAGPITTYIPVLTDNHYSPTPPPAE